MVATAVRVEQLAALELAYPTFTAVVGLAERHITRNLDLAPLARDGREGAGAAGWELGSG